ncbi:MAG: 4Fe-4S ferredoxin [Treponema sp.]|nr:MAG: 4Fe-4S ferredoxin [Treponema sp.]
MNRRHLIQALGTLAVNGNLKGFIEGKIYTGAGKKVCVPVLNCYSCPGAVASCPIGSIQASISDGNPKFNFPTYALGLTILFAILAGRFFCGYICPFGFFQDLLDKIPFFKIKIPKKLNSVLNMLRYVVLVVFVFLLPFFLQDAYGFTDPYFCKYLCPAGTLFAALPLMAINEWLRAAAGTLFTSKLVISGFIILLSTFVYRPFCRFLCPLGALLGIFNPISFYKLRINPDKCVKCKKCLRTCKLDIPTYLTPNSHNCIRCDECVHACPYNAIEKECFGIKLGDIKQKEGRG